MKQKCEEADFDKYSAKSPSIDNFFWNNNIHKEVLPPFLAPFCLKVPGKGRKKEIRKQKIHLKMAPSQPLPAPIDLHQCGNDMMANRPLPTYRMPSIDTPEGFLTVIAPTEEQTSLRSGKLWYSSLLRDEYCNAPCFLPSSTRWSSSTLSNLTISSDI